MEMDYNLREILTEMGMTHPFSRELSDLGGMANYPNIFIDEAVHKTAIDLHELGTEAAAATGAMAELQSGSPYTFYGNHPFVYIIQDHETDQILFMGRFVGLDH
jgi:serine protease inhibitor